MAKIPEKTTGSSVAKASANVPAEMMDSLSADAGMGSEDASSEDMQVPFMKIGQKLSPELDENDSAHIDGMKVGDFFNNATQQVFPKDKGFDFVPVYFVRKYLEWTPRDAGGGFNGEHPAAIMEKTTSDGKGGNFLSNGNEIVVTGTWFGFVVHEDGVTIDQAVISLAKTQLKKSRKLMTLLRSVVVKHNKKAFNPPLFYNRVRVTSVPESNDQGNWMGWKFEIVGTVFDFEDGAEMYDAAKILLDAVREGRVTTQQPDAPSNDGGGAGGDIDHDDEEDAGKKAAQADKEIPF